MPNVQDQMEINNNNTRNGSFGKMPTATCDNFNPLNSAIGNHTMNGQPTSFFTDEHSTIRGSNT